MINNKLRTGTAPALGEPAQAADQKEALMNRILVAGAVEGDKTEIDVGRPETMANEGAR